MVEIVSFHARHTEPIHDLSRPGICRNGEGDNFLELETTKAVIQGERCGFGGIALPPTGRIDAPSDFYSRCEMRCIGNPNQSYHPDERRNSRKFNDQVTEAMLGKMISNMLRHRIYSGPIFHRQQMFHDDRILDEASQGFEIVITPLAQNEAVAF